MFDAFGYQSTKDLYDLLCQRLNSLDFQVVECTRPDSRSSHWTVACFNSEIMKYEGQAFYILVSSALPVACVCAGDFSISLTGEMSGIIPDISLVVSDFSAAEELKMINKMMCDTGVRILLENELSLHVSEKYVSFPGRCQTLFDFFFEYEVG